MSSKQDDLDRVDAFDDEFDNEEEEEEEDLVATQQAPQTTFPCPLYEGIQLSQPSSAFAATAAFRRLGRLKQLGVSCHVFPSATHTRLAHSLGVAHLARTFSERLHQMQGYELDITARDIELLELAGLSHDLGHGPFSHNFERLLRRWGMHDWSHEAMSEALLDHVHDTASAFADLVNADELRRVKAMIRGKAPFGDPAWLFSIVACRRNGLDVDRLDYLRRDALFAGVRTGVDPGRVLRSARVIDDEICFNEEAYLDCAEVYSARAALHTKVYNHRRVWAVELMLMDALSLAEPVLGLKEVCHDPVRFLALDDSLPSLLRGWDVSCGSEVPRAIQDAQRLLQRIDSGEHYVCCGEVLLPMDAPRDLALDAADLPGLFNADSGHAIRPEDIEVCSVRVNATKGRSDPMQDVSFFQDADPASKFTKCRHTVSHMIGSSFEDHKVRVYSKVADKKVCEAVELAFARWHKHRGWVQPCTQATPDHICKKRSRVVQDSE